MQWSKSVIFASKIEMIYLSKYTNTSKFFLSTGLEQMYLIHTPSLLQTSSQPHKNTKHVYR